MSVYFITCRAAGIVKIGYARDPQARLSSLQTASANKLKLEAALPGSANEERELHARFAEWRVRGEWFQITADIDALIKSSGLQISTATLVPENRRRKTDEELAEESLRREHETFAECMAWRERHDPLLELDPPAKEAKAA